MVMRLVGEEAALCLKNMDGARMLGASQTDGAGGFADLNPKVPFSLHEKSMKRSQSLRSWHVNLVGSTRDTAMFVCSSLVSRP